jgi:radical SAM-linked protein
VAPASRGSTLPDVSAPSVDPARPRQRWRIRYSRDESAAALTQREEVDAWTDAVGRAALPLVTTGDPPRPRVAFGPPLPVGCVADDEPVDFLLERPVSLRLVSASLAAITPAGHSVRAIHDVWLGAPALQAAVRAVDYAVVARDPDVATVAAAAARLLAATTVPRVRARAGRESTYDLRPLVDTIVVDRDPSSAAAAPRTRIRFRFRLQPERGIGRPDELLAALADDAGAPISPDGVRRTRVWLIDDPELAPLD